MCSGCRCGAGRVSGAILRITGVWLAMAAAVVVYGVYRLGQHTQTPGPRVAVVQEFIRESVKNHPTDQQKDDIFKQHLQLSKEAIGPKGNPDKPDLIVWSETIVPEPINVEWLHVAARLAQWGRELTDQGRADVARAQSYDRQLAGLAKQDNTWLLVGSPGYAPESPTKSRMQNLAILYSPTEGQVQPYYAKRHLVPFGEFVPFGESWPWLHRLLLSLTPVAGDYTLDPGTQWTRFAMTIPGGATYHFAAPICYEDVMPEPAQAFAKPVDGRKGVDFLAAITNDGWYVSVDELEQHLQMDQLRAVEERVPIARSVNGGGSGFADSNGRVVKLVEAGGTSHFLAGWAVHTLALDSRISLYSRIGDWFPLLCGAVTALAVGWTIVRPRLGGRKGRAVIVESKQRDRR